MDGSGSHHLRNRSQEVDRGTSDDTKGLFQSACRQPMAALCFGSIPDLPPSAIRNVEPGAGNDAKARRFLLVLSTGPAGAKADLTGQRMRRLRAARLAMTSAARRAGASNVRVFGSVARGEDGPNSDVTCSLTSTCTLTVSCR
jgi:hypothetical protein